MPATCPSLVPDLPSTLLPAISPLFSRNAYHQYTRASPLLVYRLIQDSTPLRSRRALSTRRPDAVPVRGLGLAAMSKRALIHGPEQAMEARPLHHPPRRRQISERPVFVWPFPGTDGNKARVGETTVSSR